MKIISIIQEAVPIISPILIILQIYLLKKQIIKQHEQTIKQHEENRRENTVKYMLEWCNSVKKDTCIAEEVARQLTNEQGIKLYQHSAFDVSPKTKNEICKFCPLDKSFCESCSLKSGSTVDGKILTELRWHVITYLNTLETILIGWDLGIVDRKTIEEQFAFLTDPAKGNTLSQFRHSAGGYPVIEKFIRKINDTSPPRNEL